MVQEKQVITKRRTYSLYTAQPADAACVLQYYEQKGEESVGV